MALAAALALAASGCAAGGATAPPPAAGGSFDTAAVSAATPSQTQGATPSGAGSAPASSPLPFTSDTAPADPAPGGSALNGVEAASGAAVLPDRTVTPGAVNAAVTDNTISSTICTTGWTKTVRPSETYTSTLKRNQLSAGYAYSGDLNPADYEEDHLIPLELGGAPSDVRNLWPEPLSSSTGGASAKDALEDRLHSLVCAGKLPLQTAQQAIAADWWAAYTTYVGPAPAPAPAQAPAPAPAPAQAPAPAPAPAQAPAPAGAMAKCNDGTTSYSQTHSGTCSHHGGVAVWYR